MILSKLAGFRSVLPVANCWKISIRQKLLPYGKPQLRREPVSLIVRLVSGATLASTAAYKGLSLNLVQCQKKSRIVQLNNENTQPDFNWNLFFQFVKPDWLLLIVAVLSALLTAAFNIQIPIHLGKIITVVTRFIERDTEQSFVDAVRTPVAKLIALYVGQSLFTFFYIATLSHMGERLSVRLREALFESIVRQDMAFFDKTRTGELMHSLSSDVQELKSSFKQCVSHGLKSIAQTIGCVFSLYSINGKMTAVMFLIVSGTMAVGTYLGSGLRKMSTIAQKQEAHAVGVADEAITNIRTVRTFAMEDTEIALLHDELMKSQHYRSMLGLGIGAFQAMTGLALNGIVLSTLFAGGKLIKEGELTVGSWMSFLAAIQMIQKSLAQIFLLYGQFVKGIACGGRILELIERRPSIPLRGGVTIDDSTFAGEIRLRNVSFSYPTRPGQKVLDRLSIAIPPGKVVALCGASGSGKSTVAALIERLYDVDEGEILIDGVNVRQVDPAWLRGRATGLISQEPVLFAASIMENIRYGRPSASDNDVIEAAKQANAHDFIQRFEKQYDTIIGERGITISGGQKQRIAIARALLKNPQILILDEATSALDLQSEQVVQETLDKVAKGRTVLVIAHRLSTIKNADIIYVMQNGKLVESGDHQSLTSLKGAYWRLTQQAKDEERVRASGSNTKSFFRAGG